MSDYALKTHGITADTPKNLMFSAGTFYKNLEYKTNAWTGTVLGATSGGGKLSITPEYINAELDGATVAVKGAKFKVGETATIEANFTEVMEGRVVDALHLVEDTTATVTGYKVYKSKAILTDDDFLKNVAFVGTLTDGKQVIVILPNALCTSAFELEGKNKTQATYACTFECHADITQDDLYHLPYEIYFPSATE
ncbi:MAG: hypothetical protein Q4C64_02375 [Erysipelotrichia bacterium]|nr:hypothetical protein [Erysipelotrichia bacterium]